MRPDIVLVDDEIDILDAYSFALRSAGFPAPVKISDSRKAVDTVRELKHPVVILDLNMPHMSGQEVLGRITEELPATPVIVCTANSEVETAVECLKLGAHDYLVKPVDASRLESAVRSAVEIRALREEVALMRGAKLREGLKHPEMFAGIVTRSQRLRAVFQYIEAIAGTGQPVLILGETGTGKEMIARAVHEASQRSGEFVALDVSGLDDQLFSDTLFGHEKGAFTGADKARPGLIEKAAGGTIFLDEIGDLSEASQVKLLRLVQEGTYYPLGSDAPKKASARIIAAANRDIPELAGEGGVLRTDLYYRLSTHLVQMPPLRERMEDIPDLVHHFVTEAAASMGKDAPKVTADVLAAFSGHNYPGNVRELKTYVLDAVAMSTGDTLETSALADRLSLNRGLTGADASGPATFESLYGEFPTIEAATKALVEEAMKRSGGNQSRAAKLLGITRQALNRRLKGE